MRRTLVALLLCAPFAAAALSLPAHAQKVVMKVSTSTPAGETNVWMDRFKQRVEARAPGRIDVQLYPSGQLGSIPSTIEGVALGTIEANVLPVGFLKGLETRFEVADAPGVFADARHAHRTFTHPKLRQTFLDLAEAKGVKGISVFVPGGSSIVSRDRPIAKMEDYRGLKMRVLASDMEVESIRLLGAAPTPMPISEVLPALQQGAIDAVKAGITVFVPFRYWSVAKYLTLTGENMVVDMAFVGKKWWDGLPADMRAIMLEEGQKLENEISDWAVTAHAGMHAAWKQNGGVIVDFPADELAKLRARIEPVGATVVAKKPALKPLYDQMLAVAAETRQ